MDWTLFFVSTRFSVRTVLLNCLMAFDFSLGLQLGVPLLFVAPEDLGGDSAPRPGRFRKALPAFREGMTFFEAPHILPNTKFLNFFDCWLSNRRFIAAVLVSRVAPVRGAWPLLGTQDPSERLRGRAHVAFSRRPKPTLVACTTYTMVVLGRWCPVVHTMSHWHACYEPVMRAVSIFFTGLVRVVCSSPRRHPRRDSCTETAFGDLDISLLILSLNVVLVAEKSI